MNPWLCFAVVGVLLALIWSEEEETINERVITPLSNQQAKRLANRTRHGDKAEPFNNPKSVSKN